MYNDIQTSAIISAGMKLLRENLGIIESEIFITTVGRNNLDYTKWRKNLWENLCAKELFEQTANHDYVPPKNVQII